MFDPWVGKIPWRKAWEPIPVFLPGESHGQRSLAGPCRKELDATEVTEHVHKHIVIYYKYTHTHTHIYIYNLTCLYV